MICVKQLLCDAIFFTSLIITLGQNYYFLKFYGKNSFNLVTIGGETDGDNEFGVDWYLIFQFKERIPNNPLILPMPELYYFVSFSEQTFMANHVAMSTKLKTNKMLYSTISTLDQSDNYFENVPWWFYLLYQKLFSNRL